MGFTGHEKESDMTEGVYTTEYRLLDSSVGRWLSVDPLYGKYPGLSPYNYCEGNPILMLDPDGRKIKVADNVYGAAENLAKIAATNLGSQIIDHLIQKHQTYILNSVIFTLSSVYDPKSHEINYVADPWMTNVDDASITSMIAMGHEMFHAFDHAKNVYNEKNAGYSVGIEEPRAVSFANYLREVYSLRPLRSKYGNIKGDFYQFQGYAHNERITDFKILGNNEDETSFGFSYTKTITEGYYKTVGYGVLAHDEFQKTGETKTECFMIVSLDKDNNASYKTYKNKKEYADTTKTW